MTKTAAFVIFLLCFYPASSQDNFFVLKKKDKTIATYGKGAYLAFLKSNGQWMAGNITGFGADSFYLQPKIILYRSVTIDTVSYPVEGFSFADVYAIPKTGIHIDFIRGKLQPSTSGGHVHFFWIKGGWLFRTAAIGYSSLHIVNSIINNQFPLSARNLGIAAGVYTFGYFLKKNYKPYIRMGRKYRFEYLN